MKKMLFNGNPLWKDLKLNFKLIDDFVAENYNKNFTLSIYDSKTHDTMEINCNPEEISEILSIISNAEHSIIYWIGINSLSKSYVVGMALTRGVFKPGFYNFSKHNIQKNNNT